MTGKRAEIRKHDATEYTRGCRCEICTDANRIAAARYRRRVAGVEPKVHGVSTYKNLGCRCEICRTASKEERARWYEANRDAISARAAQRKARRDGSES